MIVFGFQIEAVQIVKAREIISFQKILFYFWSWSILPLFRGTWALVEEVGSEMG